VPIYILSKDVDGSSLGVPKTPHPLSRNGSTSSLLEDAWDGAQPYLELELKGTGIPPQLSFDRRELVLPPVPLLTPASGTFTLICSGYDYLKLSCTISANTMLQTVPGASGEKSGSGAGKGAAAGSSSSMLLPLKVTFPQGDVVSLARQSIPVMVTLLAEKPCSFTTTLDFSDGSPGGKVFSIPVTGCSDSGLLTIAGYVASHKAQLALHCAPAKGVTLGLIPSQPKPPVAARRSSLRSVATASAGGVAAATAVAGSDAGGATPVASASATLTAATLPPSTASAPDTPCGTHYTAADANFLLRWLNGCILRQPIAAFPQDIVAGHGRPLLEAFEGLSGRTLPGRLTGRVPSSKKERSIVLFSQVHSLRLPLMALLRGFITSPRPPSPSLQYREFLSAMRTSGALLAHVRPEALLSKDDFLRVRKYAARGMYGPPFGATVLEYPSPANKARKAKRLAAAYPALSLEAWTSVTLQVCRKSDSRDYWECCHFIAPASPAPTRVPCS
jgi:hypothetical protein